MTGNIIDDRLVPQTKLIQAENNKEHIIKKATFSIGRNKENDLLIPHYTVSGSHAFIKFRNNKFFIRDNHSSNSTYLNGNKIDPETDIQLNNNDEIQFDLYKYTFLIPIQEDSGKTVLRKVSAEGENSTVLRRKDEQPKNQIIEKEDDKIHPKISGVAKGKKESNDDEPETELKQEFCPNHSAYKASVLCPVCKKAYCKLCMVEKEGKMICKNCADGASAASDGSSDLSFISSSMTRERILILYLLPLT